MIGRSAKRSLTAPQLRAAQAKAAQSAAKLEALIAAARRIAAALTQGSHAQRRFGGGENFWQFRLYQPGEEAAAIDWRRSGRDDRLYIRQREQETAQTLFLIPDLSGSMLYRSGKALASKEERALLWLFLLAELAVKSGDKAAVPGLLPPKPNKNIAESLAAALLRDASYPAKSGLCADFSALPRFARVILISDFLEDKQILAQKLLKLAEIEAHISLIAIADPAEINFPFRGDTEFEDPETGESLYFGRAEDLRAEYRAAFQAHEAALENIAARAGARLLQDRTDIAAERQLEKLLLLLSKEAAQSAQILAEA